MHTDRPRRRPRRRSWSTGEAKDIEDDDEEEEEDEFSVKRE